MGPDQHIVGPAGSTYPFQHRSYLGISAIDVPIQRQHLDRLQQPLDACCQHRRVLLASSEPQFASNNNAGTDVLFPDLHNALLDTTARIFDQIGQNVRVEQITTQRLVHNSTGSGPVSDTSRKSKSSGCHVVRRSSNDARSTGSITSRLPSLWIVASLTFSSISRGIRIA